jgi:Z1 domain
MNEHIGKLEFIVSAVLAMETRPTPEVIRQIIKEERNRRQFIDSIGDVEAETLARLLEEKHGISMGLGAVVDAVDFKPWLRDAKAGGLIEPYYWDRYRRLLAQNGLPPPVVRATDEVTDKILDRLGNPRDMSNWSRRGMVVGHVQSGKTANYTGLVCKAADAGYRLIVVIAGIHNNLRNQTQGRIDEGFIGRDTSRLASKDKDKRQKIIGVGNFDQRHFPVSLTNTIKDFNKATATTIAVSMGQLNVPVVLVIKKNANTLKHLVEWLREHSVSKGSQLVEEPMLLIDDEADNASINIKHGKEGVARINGQIRALLRMFRRSCYVGYTATPFANIFIDPDAEHEDYYKDLFPRHFIIGLDAPTNYFGANKVFVENRNQHIRYIADNEDLLAVGHKIDHDLAALPPSLIQAVRAFIVARAIRNVRGQAGQHASMLVNASRFTGIQGKLRNRVAEIVETIRNAVTVDAAKGESALENPEIAALHDVWTEEFASLDGATGWPDVQSRLYEVLTAAQVIQVNSSRASGALNYDDRGEFGQTVIAVGGFSLSRGLTLEGLTVSYFLRNSVMYDTLMQMGRWFGYRPGYEDLCRIWMPKDGVAWYAHISGAMDDLQYQLKLMEQAKATPETFGLAVRSHPESLIVTARNKMGSSELVTVSASLSADMVETVWLSANTDTLTHNRLLGRHFVEDLRATGFDLGAEPNHSRGYLLKGVPWESVRGFLSGYRSDRVGGKAETGPILTYVEARSGHECASWDLLFASVNKDEGTSALLGIPLGASRLSVVPDGRVLQLSGRNMRLGSPGDASIGMREPEVAAAEAEFRQLYEAKGVAAPKRVPDKAYLEAHRKNPLLIIRLVKAKEDTTADEPMVTWSLYFPKSAIEGGRIDYVVNTTRMRELFGADEDEDEAAGDAE